MSPTCAPPQLLKRIFHPGRHHPAPLSYALFGAPQADARHVVFYQHGWPGSRIGGAMLHDAAAQLGVAVVAVDRPGFGGSPFTPTHRPGSWAASLERLADHLGLETFSILGASGGGPFAAACARFVSQGRVSALGLLCPFAAPLHSTRGMCVANKLLLRASRYWPTLARLLWRLGGRVMAADADCIRRFTLNAHDRRAVAGAPQLARMIRAAVLEGLAGGGHGVVHEMALQWAPPGFELEDIRVGRSFVWHGTADPVIPLAMARAYERIPGCEATYFDGETHTSIVLTRMDKALRQLAEPPAPTPTHGPLISALEAAATLPPAAAAAQLRPAPPLLAAPHGLEASLAAGVGGVVSSSVAGLRPLAATSSIIGRRGGGHILPSLVGGGDGLGASGACIP